MTLSFLVFPGLFDSFLKFFGSKWIDLLWTRTAVIIIIQKKHFALLSNIIIINIDININ